MNALSPRLPPTPRSTVPGPGAHSSAYRQEQRSAPVTVDEALEDVQAQMEQVRRGGLRKQRPEGDVHA